MNVDQFLTRFSESIDLDFVVNANQDLSELDEWDSLGALSIIALFDEFNIEIAVNDVMSWQSPADAWNKFSESTPH